MPDTMHVRFTESEELYKIIVTPNGKLICNIKGDAWLKKLIRQIRWKLTGKIVV